MFGIGFTEMLLIAVVAILFLGPEKLPQTMIDIVRFFKKFKSTIADTKNELERELQISDLKAEMLSYKSTVDDIGNEIGDITNENMLQSEIDAFNENIKRTNPIKQLNDFDNNSSDSLDKTEETSQKKTTLQRDKNYKENI